MLFRAALCTAIFVATTSTQAKDVKLGDVSLRLTAPSGFCEMDDSSPAVEKLRMLLGQRNTLLASYADCESDPARTLDDFAIYTAPTSAINMRFPPDAIEKVCDRIRSQGDAALSEILRQRATDIERIFGAVKVNESKLVGVVSEDPTVCYSEFVQKITTETGSQKLLLGISAATIIRNRFVVYHLYTPYLGAQTPTNALARHKANLTKFLAANSS